MIGKFFKNLKVYIDYLMKVNFKDLFINTVVLLCIFVLAALVFVPVGIVEDVIRSFLGVFTNFHGIPALIYDWSFKVVGYILCIWGFMFLFNKRFEDIESFKEQVGNSDSKKIDLVPKKDGIEKMDLPKPKSK